MVAGAYHGYFGLDDGEKVGFEMMLTQNGKQLSAEPTLNYITRNQQSYNNKCKLEGSVNGDEVSLKIHGQDEPLEIEIESKHISKEGNFALVGDAKVISGSGKISDAIHKVMREGKLHFQAKTEANVTEKKN